MIVVTGAAGFIGSYVTGYLNRKGLTDLVLVDAFNNTSKQPNLTGKQFSKQIERDTFINWFDQNAADIKLVIHLGARTDTTEFNRQIFDELNLEYTKAIWNICTQNSIPLIYASSAATYGDGNLGFSDDHSIVSQLKPLNPYGESKQAFDLWALAQTNTPPFWVGLKFFNVYGPNEYHKGRMASVVLHTFKQIQETGQMTLFRSHNPEYKDGEQLRDFIYVADVAQIIYFFMNHPQVPNGLYNVGTGEARTFIDLASATFNALGLEPNINFKDTPEDIRDKYQYYTQAEMSKLRAAGYTADFTSLEDGITDYVQNYLQQQRYY